MTEEPTEGVNVENPDENKNENENVEDQQKYDGGEIPRPEE